MVVDHSGSDDGSDEETFGLFEEEAAQAGAGQAVATATKKPSLTLRRKVKKRPCQQTIGEATALPINATKADDVAQKQSCELSSLELL